MKRQIKTDDDKWILSSQQEIALDCLATGSNVTDTATKVGVARQTVSDWLNHNAGFQAALNQRRADVWAGCSDKLRILLAKALDVFEEEMEGYNRLKAAEGILKVASLFNNGLLPILRSADEIEKQRKVEEKERDRSLFNRELFCN